jgi:hypothetical protein
MLFMNMSLIKSDPTKRIVSAGIILSCALLALLCTIFPSCSSHNSDKGSWEGFHDGTLRVFVHYNFIDGLDGRINRATDEVLLDTARIRAETILVSFMRVHVVGYERASACQRLLPEILSGGTIRRKFCREDYCAAYIDFNVKDFLKAAE